MTVVEGERAGVDRRHFLGAAATAAALAPSLLSPPPAGAAQAAAGDEGRRGYWPAKPPDVPLYDLEVWQAAALIRTRRLSPVDLVKACLERSAAVEERVNTYVNQYPVEEVLAAAETATREIARGRYRGPLHGIPVGLKDIYLTKGKVTEGNSKLYTGFVPGFDATSVVRLKEAGAIILGKVGTSELATAMGWPGNNPWDLRRQAGGSSTGSATGVAASQFPIGMGTCTGGSIRGPAANCGITGFKPTYGTISLHGILPLAWSMDHPGPLVHSARDAALLVDAVGGVDPLDPLSRPVRRYELAKVLFDAPSRRPLRGVTVGVPAEGDYFLGVPNDEELAAFFAAVEVIKGLGATVKTVTTDALLGGRLASTSQFYDIIRSAEVAAYQAENLRAQPDNMSDEYLSRVSAGVLMPGHAYGQAQRVRRLWRDELLKVFDSVDVLIHPADNIAGLQGGGNPPPTRPSSGSKTNPWNLTGAPAVAIPTGFSSVEHMPLSLQSVAAPGNDARCLLVADAFQQATDFHKARPSL